MRNNNVREIKRERERETVTLCFFRGVNTVKCGGSEVFRPLGRTAQARQRTVSTQRHLSHRVYLTYVSLTPSSFSSLASSYGLLLLNLFFLTILSLYVSISLIENT